MSFRPVNEPSSQPGLGDNRRSVTTASPLNTIDTRLTASQDRANAAGLPPHHKQSATQSDSQNTTPSSNSTESNRVFTPTPPAIDRPESNGGQPSSQDSQLLQLSQLAAAREKMPDAAPRSSIKRTADGAVKSLRRSPPPTPPTASTLHSRNVSGVSVASTTSSRVTEVSSFSPTSASWLVPAQLCFS